MSTLLFIVVIALFVWGYSVYGRFLLGRFDINPGRKTPAYTHHDGLDYIPAKNWFLLFGHHFASIAGAGPIIGPVLAYLLWGWLPALLWIIVGTIFMGAVHDATSLIVSLREEGKSIGQIAEKYVSRRTSVYLMIFLWWTLLIVIAVFASICAKTFITQPGVVVSSLGLIPVAVIVGFFIYKLRMNLAVATAIGIVSLFGLIIWGQRMPVVVNPEYAYFFWTVVLLVYAFIASIIPVNILLQPRDYLSSFLLFFGVSVACIGLLIKPLPIGEAKLISVSSKGGFLFPMMFITVACGAISGFHSLVSSGTTSKQLTNERDVQRIGYGAMILEGVLAAIVLFSVAFGLRNTSLTGLDPAQIFSLGFASVTSFLGKYAQFIALVILNAFILTTLDTATRITRLITQEFLRLNNKWLATGLVVSVAAYFVLMQKWQVLWPLFGAANQLVAALALIVVSGWLFCKGKPFKATLIPAIIMITITVVALLLKAYEFALGEKPFAIKGILSSVAVVLVMLGVFTIIEFRKILKCRVQ